MAAIRVLTNFQHGTCLTASGVLCHHPAKTMQKAFSPNPRYTYVRKCRHIQPTCDYYEPRWPLVSKPTVTPLHLRIFTPTLETVPRIEPGVSYRDVTTSG